MTTRTHLHAPLQFTDSERDRTAQIAAAAAHRADTIDWTEVQRPDQVRAIQQLAGYDTYWPSGRPEVRPLNYAPISWRTDRYRLVDGDHGKASDGVDGEFPDKHFARVRLEDLETGERVARVSGHMVPGIQSLRDETPRVVRLTREAHASNVRVYRDLMTRGNLPTIGGTDANDTDLPTKLGKAFAYAATGPTHGRRRIDYVIGHRLDGQLTARTVSLGPGDHRGVLATHTTRTQEAPVSRTPMTDALVAALRRRGVEVLTHADWGSQHRRLYLERLRTRPHDLLPSRPVDTLWNHITVTNDDGPLSGDFAADMREVERVGVQRFGTGFSYNVGVDQDAPHPRLAIGQFLEARGAHTINDKRVPGYSLNQNKVALAVAWVGVPGDRLNEHAIEAMVQLRAALIEIGAMTDHYDDVPHSLVAAKDCPCDELRNRLPDLRRRGLAAVDARPTTDREDWLDMADKADVKAALDELLNEKKFGLNDGKWRATLEQALNHLEKSQDAINRHLKAQEDPDAFAAAVVAKLGGSADYETVKRAVKDALTEGTDDTA